MNAPTPPAGNGDPPKIIISKMNLKGDGYIDFYKLYRSYVMEESGLINSRLTWIITINGLLYASFGIALQREVDAVKGADAEGAMSDLLVDIASHTGLFLITIAVVGFMIGIIGWLSIKVAQKASHAVVAMFDSGSMSAHEVLPSSAGIRSGYATKDGYLLPNIRGGGDPGSVKLAHFASQAIPLLLAASWAVSLVSVLYVWHLHSEVFPQLF